MDDRAIVAAILTAGMLLPLVLPSGAGGRLNRNRGERPRARRRAFSIHAPSVRG